MRPHAHRHCIRSLCRAWRARRSGSQNGMAGVGKFYNSKRCCQIKTNSNPSKIHQRIEIKRSFVSMVFAGIYAASLWAR
jgi:hypothetical protein